jgi:hypothetical protein
VSSSEAAALSSLRLLSEHFVAKIPLLLAKLSGAPNQSSIRSSSTSPHRFRFTDDTHTPRLAMLLSLELGSNRW